MSTKTTQQTEVNERILEFLNKIIDAESLSKHLRRANYILALSVIRMDENNNPINPEWADNGFYWINELAELLHPVLEKED
jgi:hypothetical protein